MYPKYKYSKFLTMYTVFTVSRTTWSVDTLKKDWLVCMSSSHSMYFTNRGLLRQLAYLFTPASWNVPESCTQVDLMCGNHLQTCTKATSVLVKTFTFNIILRIELIHFNDKTLYSKSLYLPSWNVRFFFCFYS